MLPEKLYISFPPEGFTLRWYEKFLDHDQVIDSAFVSLRIALWATALTLALGVTSAFSLVRGKVSGDAPRSPRSWSRRRCCRGW